jgi:hypothetical protein
VEVVAKRDARGEDQVHLVTSAPRPHSEEVSDRARKYLISMTIRTICLVLAIFALHGWLRLIAIVAAIILPWFAVVMANAGPVGNDDEPEFVTTNHPEIEARRSELSSGDSPQQGDSAQRESAAQETIGARRRTG